MSRTKKQPMRAKELSEALYDLVSELANATCLIATAKRSLEHRDSNWDEIATLEAGLKMLKEVDQALNRLADDNSPVTPSMPGIGETPESGRGE
ncbi:MAG: hypothetical protein ACJ8R9_02490 [Steroidobacteraceae bacterium]